jgi:ubiquitin carboxyl-terminal hydrolase 10
VENCVIDCLEVSIGTTATLTTEELNGIAIAVVYHHGSTATGGHYTACVLKQDGKGWLHLDDELVENVEGDAGVYVTRDAAVHGDAGTVGRSMRSKCAYLLFYARV